MKDGGDGGWVGGWWDWEGRGTREVRGGGGAGVKMGGELYMVCAVPFRRRSRRVDSCSCSSPASPTYTHTPPLPPAPRRAATMPFSLRVCRLSAAEEGFGSYRLRPGDRGADGGVR